MPAALQPPVSSNETHVTQRCGPMALMLWFEGVRMMTLNSAGISRPIPPGQEAAQSALLDTARKPDGGLGCALAVCQRVLVSFCTLSIWQPVRPAPEGS